MKKLFLYMVLGLLWYSVSFAETIVIKCITYEKFYDLPLLGGKKTEKTNDEYVYSFDLEKKLQLSRDFKVFKIPAQIFVNENYITRVDFNTLDAESKLRKIIEETQGQKATATVSVFRINRLNGMGYQQLFSFNVEGGKYILEKYFDNHEDEKKVYDFMEFLDEFVQDKKQNLIVSPNKHKINCEKVDTKKKKF